MALSSPSESVGEGGTDDCPPLLDWAVRIVTAPVYVPLVIGMWVGFYLTDMQGSTDSIVRSMQTFAERNDYRA